MRWIYMEADEKSGWLEFLGTDPEWEHIRATDLHRTHEGTEVPQDPPQDPEFPHVA